MFPVLLPLIIFKYCFSELLQLNVDFFKIFSPVLLKVDFQKNIYFPNIIKRGFSKNIVFQALLNVDLKKSPSILNMDLKKYFSKWI